MSVTASGRRDRRGRLPDRAGVPVLPQKNGACGGGGPGRGHLAPADPAGGRRAVFRGAGQRRSFHDLLARETQGPADFERPVLPPAGEPDVSRPRYLLAGGGAPGGRVPPSRMGKLIQDYLRPSFEKPQRTGKRTWTGRILRIDRFGNIVTNFHESEFPGPGPQELLAGHRTAAGRGDGAQLRRMRPW